MWVQCLSQEDPLEKEMATHSSVLAWKIPWTEEPGRLQSVGLQRVRQDWATEHQRIYLILCGSSPESLKKVYSAHSAWDASPSSLCLTFTSLPGGVRCLLAMCHQSLSPSLYAPHTGLWCSANSFMVLCLFTINVASRTKPVPDTYGNSIHTR